MVYFTYYRKYCNNVYLTAHKNKKIKKLRNLKPRKFLRKKNRLSVRINNTIIVCTKHLY